MITKRFHNVYDLENCNEKIGNRNDVREFVEKVAQAIDMTILEGPIVAEGIEDNPGFSALVIVDFSHISVHTFTKNREALIDVFSCKEYDRERVLNVCKEFFSTPETTIRQKEVWWG
jgi:S-adenosylmethionine decarboxylase